LGACQKKRKVFGIVLFFDELPNEAVDVTPENHEECRNHGDCDVMQV
jgi:hypothetical protein